MGVLSNFRINWAVSLALDVCCYVALYQHSFQFVQQKTEDVHLLKLRQLSGLRRTRHLMYQQAKCNQIAMMRWAVTLVAPNERNAGVNSYFNVSFFLGGGGRDWYIIFKPTNHLTSNTLEKTHNNLPLSYINNCTSVCLNYN